MDQPSELVVATQEAAAALAAAYRSKLAEMHTTVAAAACSEKGNDFMMGLMQPERAVDWRVARVRLYQDALFAARAAREAKTKADRAHLKVEWALAQQAGTCSGAWDAFAAQREAERARIAPAWRASADARIATATKACEGEMPVDKLLYAVQHLVLLVSGDAY